MGTTIYGVDTFVPLFVQGARGGNGRARRAPSSRPSCFCGPSRPPSAPARRRLRVSQDGALGRHPDPDRPDGPRGRRMDERLACPGSRRPAPSSARVWALLHRPGAVDPERRRRKTARRRHEPRALLPNRGRLDRRRGTRRLARCRPGDAPRARGRNRRTFSGLGRRRGRRSCPAAFRVAIERSLLPLFAILAGVAVLDLLVTRYFPECPWRSSRARRRSRFRWTRANEPRGRPRSPGGPRAAPTAPS